MNAARSRLSTVDRTIAVGCVVLVVSLLVVAHAVDLARMWWAQRSDPDADRSLASDRTESRDPTDEAEYFTLAEFSGREISR